MNASVARRRARGVAAAPAISAPAGSALRPSASLAPGSAAQLVVERGAAPDPPLATACRPSALEQLRPPTGARFAIRGAIARSGWTRQAQHVDRVARSRCSATPAGRAARTARFAATIPQCRSTASAGYGSWPARTRSSASRTGASSGSSSPREPVRRARHRRRARSWLRSRSGTSRCSARSERPSRALGRGAARSRRSSGAASSTPRLQREVELAEPPAPAATRADIVPTPSALRPRRPASSRRRAPRAPRAASSASAATTHGLQDGPDRARRSSASPTPAIAAATLPAAQQRRSPRRSPRTAGVAIVARARSARPATAKTHEERADAAQQRRRMAEQVAAAARRRRGRPSAVGAGDGGVEHRARCAAANGADGRGAMSVRHQSCRSWAGACRPATPHIA